MSFRAWPLDGQRPDSDQRLRQRRARAFEFGFAPHRASALRPTISLKVLSAMPSRPPPNKNLAGAHGLGGGALAVNQIGHGPGQRLVGGARFGLGLMLRGQRGDFLFAQKGEKIQVTHHVAVVGANPELVEAIDAGFAGVHPDGAGGGFAEFGAVAVENQRQGQAEDVRAQLFCGSIPCRR